MERDWERLGRAFAQARTAAGLTQEQVAEQLHVSRTPIQAIERGRQPNGRTFAKVTATMRSYARLVGWTEASPDLIVDGQEPEPATQPVSAPAGDSQSGPPSAVARELRSGKTLDHAVVHLGTTDDDDTRLIVVLQGAEDMSEEEIDAAWQKWRQTRRRLQAIPGETDNPQES
ncbi:helix-turn-helix domain-containing protein [Streptomyces canus]|uniref:helix-turn-helix domain-containing protein n=1 Tax=Streptomyces canus TaxID=58343 RepID=UPI00324AB1DE